MRQPKPQKFGVMLALTTVQVLFGINYVVSKIVVDKFPPMIWASIRVVISAVALLFISRLSGRKSPKLNKKYVLHLILYTLLGIVINQASFLIGLSYTTATNSAILNTLIPIFTLLLVTISGREPLTFSRACGFFCALAGVLVIRKIETFSLSDQTLIGDLLVVLNCLSYGIFLTISKKFFEKHDPLWTTTWLFTFGSVFLTLLSIPGWSEFQWPEMSNKLAYSMAFSIVGSTLLAYLLNLWALARVQSSLVALFIYLQPIVASVLAWIWMGEVITLRTIFSSGLIFIGMLLAMRRS